MRSGGYSIAIEAQIIFTRRELAVLHHVASYDHQKWFEGMKSSHYEGDVSVDEMRLLFEKLKQETASIMAKIQDSKVALFGNTPARIPEKIEIPKEV